MKNLIDKNAALQAFLVMNSMIFTASSNAAIDMDNISFYGGGDYGLSRVNNSDFDENNNSAVKLFVGGKLNDYIGIEGALNDFGRSENNGNSADLTGNTLAIVGFFPIAEQYEVFVKGGRLWWSNKLIVQNTFTDTLTGNENFYGLGAIYNYTDMLSLRAEFEWYKVEFALDQVGIDIDSSSHVDVANLGVAMKF